MKRASLVVSGLGLCLLLGTGCVDRRAFVNLDPWFAPAPAGGPPADASARLDPSIVRLVIEPQETEAEELLASRSWLRITPDQAAHLAGWTNAPTGPEGDLYLIRGVATLQPDARGLYVYRLPGNDLLVNFGTLGKSPQRMIKQPLVVWLDRPPRNVYADVTE
jgi:hypothetical protein